MRQLLLFAFVVGFFPLVSWSAEADPDLDYAEKVLKDEQIKSDVESLQQFFKTRCVTEEDRARLKLEVRKLGDESFEVREKASATLKTSGRPARPFLLQALGDPDPEIVHRAEEILDLLEEGREMMRVSSAARVLANRDPRAATEALLTFLPCASDESMEDTIFAILARSSVASGSAQPALVQALQDKEPTRRAAAAFALGALKEYRAEVVKLLDDKDVQVRFRACSVLVPAGEKKAIDTLLALLTDAPIQTAHLSEDMLFRLASQKTLPEATLSENNPESRRKVRRAWEKWWKDNQDQVDLTKVNLEESVLGFTVIAEYSNSGLGGRGRIWECGPDGKQRWEITDVASPMDVQVLAGGRVLVAESGRGVTERDRTGKVLWEVKVNNPVCCQRLPNGNTFAATYTELFEFDRAGKQVFHFAHNKGTCYDAQKLRNGNYVYMVNSGQVTEVNPDGKEIRTFKPDSPDVAGCGYWVSIGGLANGNFLVSMGSTGRVAEVDGTGKVLWSCKTDQTTGACRLRSGNTLCCGTETSAVIEYDRNGKEVWRAKTVGRPFRARRY
jgi:hypothetical protein